MMVVYGGNAFTAFKLDKLKAEINRQTGEEISRIDCISVYFIKTSAGLNPQEQKTLKTILGIVGADKEYDLWVIPRAGTISAWSSKATDICRQCGLDKLERIERGRAFKFWLNGKNLSRQIAPFLFDRMTEQVVFSTSAAEKKLFTSEKPASFNNYDIKSGGKERLQQVDAELGLALDDNEIDYLYQSFNKLDRNPTDVELMSFAQANSEHCRHKIFNALFFINDKRREHSLFELIKLSCGKVPGVISAYKDNAAVIAGNEIAGFYPVNNKYRKRLELSHIVYKAETHNHPTAISPFAGAATGAGGEIRDCGATGTGAKPKFALCGFAVSNLDLPDLPLPWEFAYGKPERIASALDIMLDAPIGAAAYNNEFGRPVLGGFFRAFLLPTSRGIRGYHKPVMLSGGLGRIKAEHACKKAIPDKALILMLGGPAMQIGLGGGAASSMFSGQSDSGLDFASVQRGNPEMERRCQEVIDRLWQMGGDNPILSIHDVGAGGLSNAVPEIVHDSGMGGKFELRNIPNDEPGMSPLAIWCNESQERYVIAVMESSLEVFSRICQRERCPFAVLGTATTSKNLVLSDKRFLNLPINIPLDLIFGKPPKMVRKTTGFIAGEKNFNLAAIDLKTAIYRVLRIPSVAAKSFLITIGDRTVGGQVHRDQMVGRWQTPVADAAVGIADFTGYAGEAVALGERSPIALISGPSAARMTLAEAITNIAAAKIERLTDIKLSANWMAAAGSLNEDFVLYRAVKALSQIAQELGLCIPVGKDSMSMRTLWREGKKEKSVISPLSLIISAFAKVSDVRLTLTPELKREGGAIFLIDLGQGKNRLGGSCLLQAYSALGNIPPDLDNPAILTGFFAFMQQANPHILAYHDRSDGGVLITLLEMAFAARTGLDIYLEVDEPLAALFAEEAGAVIQVKAEHRAEVLELAASYGLDIVEIAALRDDGQINIHNHKQRIFSTGRIKLNRVWMETSFHIRKQRDNPDCAQQEFDSLLDEDDPGLSFKSSFNVEENPAQVYINSGVKPKIAILREQGVNGQLEMAAAFARAGFECIDVHMSDLIKGDRGLETFNGLAACGGFSYGDVLGAGRGWANSVLLHTQTYDKFYKFFNRTDTFTLGVCNGCQMLSAIRELIPGADNFPEFKPNLSAQFEARFSLVEILPSPSILLAGMEGSVIPVAVAHGEGRVEKHEDGYAVLRFVNGYGEVAGKYPANPNGSIQGLTGFTSADGRTTIMMPHPERVFRAVQNSWFPGDKSGDAPWMRMFYNARAWVG